MFRKLVGTLVVMTVAIGFVAAGEYNCVVSKVDGNKITCYKTKKGKKVGEEFVLTVNSDAVIAKGTFDKDTKKFVKGDALEGGLKHDVFAKIGDKGVTVNVTTDDGDKKASQILVIGKKKAAAE